MSRLVGPRIIAAEKIHAYLLALDHVDGGPKARFFMSFGFTREDPNQLTAALLDHAARHPVLGERSVERGTSRLVRGTLMSPDHRHPIVDAIWFQALDDDDGHRLITAYPA